MAIRMALPKIGVNMTEAVIIKWLIKPGDKINEGDAVIEAETDKAIQEFLSTHTGTVAELLFSEGDTVQIYEDYVILIEEGEEYSAQTQPVPAPQTEPAPVSEPIPVSEPTLTSAPAPISASASTTAPAPVSEPDIPLDNKRVRISPLAKKIALENNIDINQLSPAERGYRIVKADVLRHLDSVLMQKPVQYTDDTQPESKTVIKPDSNYLSSSAVMMTTVDATGILDFSELCAKRGMNFVFDTLLYKIAAHAAKLKQSTDSIIDNKSITITNLSAFDVEMFAPVIKPPELINLTVGVIKSQFIPDENDRPTLKKNFQLVMAFDHRFIDNITAAQFLKNFKDIAENPVLMV